MPAGTKVDRVYRALLKQGHSSASAARIAQAQTGETLATGKRPKRIAMAGPLFTRVGPPPPPPRPTNAAKEAGHAAADSFNAQSDRAMYDKYRTPNTGKDIVAPAGGTVGPKPPPPPGRPQAPVGQIAASNQDEDERMMTPTGLRKPVSPGHAILNELRRGREEREKEQATGPSGAKSSPSDVSRPAWQYLPDTDTGDQPGRSDYRNAGFRMLPRQPDSIHG